VQADELPVAILSPQRIVSLFAEGDAAATSHDKGRKLEELIMYAFGRVPGVKFYKSNVLNNPGSEEVDVAFFNSKQKAGLPFLEFLLLVECKNWSTPVGAVHVREFATKLEHRACAYGVLIAANGITGDPAQRTAAHDAVRMALATKGISIIVITRAEIEAWGNTSDIIELVKTKLCELTVAGSIFV
jgi:Restriction endonuclease